MLQLLGIDCDTRSRPGASVREPGDEVIPWLDQPPPSQYPPTNVGNLLVWEELDSWLTCPQFFLCQPLRSPQDLDEATWRLEVTGLVARPQSLTIADLKARERHAVNFTLECSGNHGSPDFIGGVGNARWGGTRLASLLEEAGVLDNGTEVVF